MSAGSVPAGEGLVDLRIDLNKFSEDLKTAQDKMQAFGRKLSSIGTSFAAAGVGILAPLAGASKEFASFEESMAKVGTVIDGNQTAMDKFGKQVRELSTQFGVDTSIMADGLYDILSASVPTGQAIDVLTVATKAAVGGFTDTKTAADALTTVLNSYGKSAEDAAAVSDVFFTIQRRGKTTFAQLAPVIGQVANLANNAGVSFEELGAMLALLTRNGVQTSEAITSIKAIISSFLKPTKEAADVAEQMGLKLDAAALKAKGLGGVFQEIAGLPSDTVAKLFPNIGAVTGLLPALNAMDQFQGDLDAMQKAAGATEAASSKMVNTINRQYLKMVQEIKSAMVEIGAAIKEPVRALIVWIKQIVPAITVWIAENHGLVIGVGKLGVALLATGAGLKAVAGAISSIITLNKAFRFVMDANLATKMGPVLQSLASGFRSVGSAIAANTKNLWTMLKAIPGPTAAFEAIKGAATAGMAALKTSIAGALTSISTASKTAFSSMLTTLKGAPAAASAAFTSLQTAAVGAFASIKAAAIAAAPAIATVGAALATVAALAAAGYATSLALDIEKVVDETDALERSTALANIELEELIGKKPATIRGAIDEQKEYIAELRAQGKTQEEITTALKEQLKAAKQAGAQRVDSRSSQSEKIQRERIFQARFTAIAIKKILDGEVDALNSAGNGKIEVEREIAKKRLQVQRDLEDEITKLADKTLRDIIEQRRKFEERGTVREEKTIFEATLELDPQKAIADAQAKLERSGLEAKVAINEAEASGRVLAELKARKNAGQKIDEEDIQAAEEHFAEARRIAGLRVRAEEESYAMLLRANSAREAQLSSQERSMQEQQRKEQAIRDKALKASKENSQKALEEARGWARGLREAREEMRAREIGKKMADAAEENPKQYLALLKEARDRMKQQAQEVFGRATDLFRAAITSGDEADLMAARDAADAANAEKDAMLSIDQAVRNQQEKLAQDLQASEERTKEIAVGGFGQFGRGFASFLQNTTEDKMLAVQTKMHVTLEEILAQQRKGKSLTFSSGA